MKKALKKTKREAPKKRNTMLKKSKASAHAVLFGKVKSCIDEIIRPLIQMDGGDIEVVELTPENVLLVRLHGACVGCAAAGFTLQFGVQNAIDEAFPDEDIEVRMAEMD
jgi:Fe-S cluster biogenesis protein NfuA